MGLLDDLRNRIPSAYDDYAMDKCKAIMDKCQEYWDAIREAQVEVLSYKALYLRAVESIDFAIKQFGNAADKLENQIGDDEKMDPLNEMKKNIEELTALNSSITSKTEEFAEIDRKITAYSKEITEINKKARDTWDSAAQYIQSKYTPMINSFPGGLPGI